MTLTHTLPFSPSLVAAPAHHAGETGRHGVLQTISDLVGNDSLSFGDIDGRRPAHLAALAGHEESLLVLRHLGVEVDTATLMTLR